METTRTTRVRDIVASMNFKGSALYNLLWGKKKVQDWPVHKYAWLQDMTNKEKEYFAGLVVLPDWKNDGQLYWFEGKLYDKVSWQKEYGVEYKDGSLQFVVDYITEHNWLPLPGQALGGMQASGENEAVREGGMRGFRGFIEGSGRSEGSGEAAGGREVKFGDLKDIG